MSKPRVLSILLMLCLILPPANVLAGEMGFAAQSASKLGRGAKNMVTSVVEVSCQMYYDLEDRPYTGALSGLLKGAVFMVRRALVGVADTVTFLIPSEPMIEDVCSGESWNYYAKLNQDKLKAMQMKNKEMM